MYSNYYNNSNHLYLIIIETAMIFFTSQIKTVNGVLYDLLK